MASDKPGVLAGFKDFVLRGNVVDLATAVVVGAAFTGVVNAVARDFVGSLVAAVGGSPDVGSIGPVVNGTQIQVGTVITAAINFLVVAAVVYFLVVVPLNRLLGREREAEAPGPVAVPEDVALLREIRDLLREGSHPPGGAPGAGGTTT